MGRIGNFYDAGNAVSGHACAALHLQAEEP